MPDVSAYINAGYTVQCFCRLDSAYGYVGRQMAVQMGRAWNEMLDDGTFIRYNKETENFEMNVGDEEVPMWVPTNYYWEENILLWK